MECVRSQRAIDARRRRESCVREGRNFAKFRHGVAWGWYRKDLVPADGIPELAAGGGSWRRVAEAHAIDAWRAANGTADGASPAAVVVEDGAGRGHVIYRGGSP